MKTRLFVALALLASAFATQAADEVSPSTNSFRWLRDEGVGQISDQSYYEGSTLRLTNCTLYAGTATSSPVQGLTAVTMELRVGNATTNVPYTPSVQNTNGIWWANILVPSNITPCYLQMKLSDATTNIYIYPWKTMSTKDPLQ